MANNDLELISRAKFRQMQGNVSSMTIHRREKAIPNYPKPVKIQRRAFYYLADVEAYLAALRDDSAN